MSLAWQGSLFAAGVPRPDETFSSLERVVLDDASWIDLAPGWLGGADELFAEVAADAPWQANDVWMYERRVATPRLAAAWDAPPDVVGEMARVVGARYGVELPARGFNLYRDGRDSVAWHGDRVARDLPEAIVAIVSLGGRRRFLLRPNGGGESRSMALRSGDLLVMGGATQRLWQHSIPKQRAAEPRVSITFRHRGG